MKQLTKNILAALALATLCATARAQATGTPVFDKGTNVINLGIGLGTTLYGSGYDGTFPPITIAYERGIANGQFGIGGYLAHTGARYGDKHDYLKYAYTVIGIRGDYHFYMTDKLDTYGGLMLGYDIVTDKWHGEGEPVYKDSGSEAAYSLFVGARYYFAPSIGAFAELGYGIAVLNLGLAFKF